MTGREHEHTVSLVNGFFGNETAHVRSEVRTAGKCIFLVGDTRVFLVRDAYIVVAFIVFEEYVILWLMLFYERTLQHKSFILAVNNDIVIVIDIRHHSRNFRCMVGILTEIACHTVFEIFRLSDVDYSAFPVLHDVNSGRRSQLGRFLTQIG